MKHDFVEMIRRLIMIRTEFKRKVKKLSMFVCYKIRINICIISYTLIQKCPEDNIVKDSNRKDLQANIKVSHQNFFPFKILGK